MRTSTEIRKAYEEKQAERYEAKLEVVTSAANYISDILFEEAKKGKFAPNMCKDFNILDLERLWINNKYGFSGSTICGDELHAILNKNGIDFEKINNSQIRVFLSK